MEGRPTLAPSTVLFIAKFKNFLDSTGLTADQFLQNFRTINTNQLSRLEYFRIISLINIQTYNNFDSQLVFKELSHGNQTIKVTELKKLTEKLGGIITEKKQSEDKARQEDMKKKVVRIGLHKLQEFIKNHPSPIVFFYQFDADQNGSINKVQFGKMLIATEIREFASKDIRKILVDHLFKYFPKGQITVKELANFFKIKYETFGQKKGQMPQKHHTLDCQDIPHKKPQPISKNNSFEHPKNPSPNKNVNPFGKKGEAGMLSPNYQPKPQMKKDDSYENHDNNISNCFAMYPLSMRYFRQGEPEPSEYQVLEELQAYLNRNMKYSDKENPRISDGAYTPSSDIFKSQYYIFQMAASVLMRQKSRIGVAQQIQPKDIIQGSVGDCYFLSSIASIISIYPELIADKFLLNINPANLYAVKLFIDGEWKVIVTDDRFPCKGRVPMFAKPHHNQIWVMLLQKCWAKVFGSYKNIEAGSSKEGFIALSGAPCQVISLEKQEEAANAVKQLQIAQKKRYVATMSGSNYLESMGKAGQQQYGLVGGHAYSLLKIISVQGQTLVKLRNPWGKTVWKGEWSFKSNRWTPALRDKYNYNKCPDDGSFYMSWKDFRLFFGQIIICKLNPTYMHDSIRVKSDRHKSAYFSMKVTTPGQYIVSIYQENKRKMLLKYENYTYSEARVIILKRQNNKMRYVGSRSTSQYQVCSCDLELEEGEYIISAKIKWKFWNDHEFVLTSYGTDHANIVPINRSIAPAFKEQMIKSYARMYEGTGKIKSYEKYGFDAVCETNFSLDTGIGFVRMVNKSNKGFESVQNYEYKGLKIIKPDRLPLEFKMTGTMQKIYGFFVSAGGFQYSNTEKIKY